MKKLNLKLGSIREMLSKEQMKKVVGGTDYLECINGCGSEATRECSGNTDPGCYYSAYLICVTACANDSHIDLPCDPMQGNPCSG